MDPGNLTVVKKMLAEGNTMGVMELTGKAYSLTGRVMEGNKIGRTLGFPTANMELYDNESIIPARGVYAAMVYVRDTWYAAMVNIGIRPTINLHRLTVEAHLFNFSKEIYGETFSIHFLKYIRNEMRFTSLEELKRQLQADKKIIRKVIAETTPGIISNGEALVWVRSS